MNRRLNYGELIAAQASNGVRLAGAPSQPAGRAFEQPVPDRVSISVVDDLEPIDIEIQDRDIALSWNTRERAPQTFEEQNAIGQIGQRIVEGHMSYSPLGPATLGDILVNGDPASARHRLIFNLNHTAVSKFLDLDAGISCRRRGEAIGDIFVNVAEKSAGSFAVDKEVAKREARLNDLGGGTIHFEISTIQTTTRADPSNMMRPSVILSTAACRS